MEKSQEQERSPQLYNKSNYIILPGRTHGKHEFEDLFVAKYRLRSDDLVRKVAKNLGLRAMNTRSGLFGRAFIGEIDWNNALKLNLSLKGETLSPRRFIDFKELLEFGLNGGAVYDGTGKKIKDLRVIKVVYYEIFAKKDPWRGEWLDAYFEENDIKGEYSISYNHYLSGKELKPGISEPLQDCLRIKEYLFHLRFNGQGLPIKEENFNYFPPYNNSVAWFYADSGRAILSCDGDPSDTDSSLGVRHARKKF
ncbi:hypothetical protein HYW75_05820 [Candidatus Pacearchaeota archaeon]|nr:hypothetical protein [Candidatus Pacearchaeota archaeon]